MAAGARRLRRREKGSRARERNSSLLVSARQLQAPVRRPLQRTAPLTQPEAAPIDAGPREPAPAGAVAVMASNRPLLTRLTRSQSRPPNGSRLSCGRNAHGRKAAQRQIKKLASEGTQFFPTGERPAASSAC